MIDTYIVLIALGARLIYSTYIMSLHFLQLAVELTSGVAKPGVNMGADLAVIIYKLTQYLPNSRPMCE